MQGLIAESCSLLLLQLLRDFFRDLRSQVGQHFVYDAGNGSGIVRRTFWRLRGGLLCTGSYRHGGRVWRRRGIVIVILVLLVRLGRPSGLLAVTGLPDLPPARPGSRSGCSYFIFCHIASRNFFFFFARRRSLRPSGNRLRRCLRGCGSRCGFRLRLYPGRPFLSFALSRFYFFRFPFPSFPLSRFCFLRLALPGFALSRFYFFRFPFPSFLLSHFCFLRLALPGFALSRFYFFRFPFPSFLLSRFSFFRFAFPSFPLSRFCFLRLALPGFALSRFCFFRFPLPGFLLSRFQLSGFPLLSFALSRFQFSRFALFGFQLPLRLQVPHRCRRYLSVRFPRLDG